MFVEKAIGSITNIDFMVFSMLKELAPWQFKYRAFNLQSLYELKHVPEGAGLNSHRCLDGNPPV